MGSESDSRLARSARSSGSDAADLALKELEPKLAAIPDDAVVKPHADPQGAAVTALLVADWLSQPDVAPRLASAGADAALASDLALVARGVLHLVERIGGEYLPDGKGIPGDLVHRGQAVRSAAVVELDKTLARDAEAKAWLDAVRLGAGVVDLVYDLRTLGALHAMRAHVLPAEAAKIPSQVRAAADGLEYALRAGESADEAQARAAITKLWTILAPLYDRAAQAGRELTRGAGSERAFPALPLVASHRRAKRRPLSFVGTNIGSVPPPPSNAAAGATDATGEPITFLKSEPPPPGKAGTAASIALGRAQTWTESRCAIRHLLEIEVSIERDGATHAGFTENMSTGGVFVATYMTAKQGTKVNVALTMRGGEVVRLPGEVRWQRPSSIESWPGVGVQFDGSGPEHEARMNRLLSLRDRML